MMRHSVIWAAQVVEPDPAGTWVKHEEASLLKEAVVQREALLATKDKEIAQLIRGHDAKIIRLDQEISEKDVLIGRQVKMLKGAKERLKTLGHSPNCASRYGKIGMDGNETHGACSCGLDAWLSECLG